MTTAIVIGATGATGQPLLELLLAGDDYAEVLVFTRRRLPIEHPKLTQHIVDFEKLPDWEALLQGDDLFSALGTTRKLAGSQAAQYRVDYTYQANVLAAAKRAGVKRVFLVSSPGAHAASPFFYTRMKGELDQYAAGLGFDTLVYFKPSLIVAQRPEGRLAEKWGAKVLYKIADCVPAVRPRRPIQARELAQAIVNSAVSPLPSGIHTFELGDVFDLLDN